MEKDPTIDKVQFIRDNIDTMTWQKMSEHTGVSDRYLRQLAKDNGINKTHKKISTEDLKYLKANIDKKTWKQLCKKFGYGITGLSDICAKNNIHKTPDKGLSTNDADEMRKKINLKSWPELSKIFGYSSKYLKEFCKKHDIVKEAWSHKNIKNRIEQSRTFNTKWLIEGGTLDKGRKDMVAKWKKSRGELKEKHILVFKNNLNTFEDLIEIPSKTFNVFKKKRNARILEKQWATKQILVNGVYVKQTLGNISVLEKNRNKVAVRTDHKTIRFMDINLCEKNEFNQWVLKIKQDS